MSDNPGDDTGDQGPEGSNPFSGTPFEHLFGGAGAGVPDLTAILSQMQSLMQPHEGPINWDLAIDGARKLVAQTPDPSPTQRQKDAVADAVQLADHWLDDATGFPSGVHTTAAWSRAEWVVGTTEVWKVLVEPVVAHLVSAMGSALPGDARAMAGPLIGMLEQDDRPHGRRPGRLRPSAASPARCCRPPTSACRSAPPGRQRWCSANITDVR